MRRLLVVLSLLVALTPAARARAADDGAAEQARARFSAGVKLYDAHDYEKALEEFRAARALHPSPTITRNVALCLKALERWGEALDAFEDLLAEGGEGLSAEVKEGAHRALEELRPRVVDVRLRIILRGPPPVPVPTASVDRATVPPARLTRPLHLAPGEHELAARADGYFDAHERVRLSPGQGEQTIDLEPTPASIVGRGRLTLRATVPGASLALDGTPLPGSAWSGEVPAGRHSVEGRAPGMAPRVVPIELAAGGALDVLVDFPEKAPEPPPPPGPRRDWYASAGVSLFGEALVFSGVLDDPAKGHSLGGASLVLRGGRRLGSHVSLGLAAEVGGATSGSYKSASDSLVSASADVISWMVVPELRVHGASKLRAFGGVGAGVEGTHVDATVSSKSLGGTTGGPASVSGSGVSGAFLIEGGAQLELGRVYLELAAFLNIHGVGNVTTGSSRFFTESPAARSGLRAMVGYLF